MLATTRLNRLPAQERGVTLGDFFVPVRIGEHMGTRLRHVALVCVGAAFIALTSNVAFRLPGTPVPITGQTLAILLVGGALGLRRGLLSIGLYIALGFFLPVYANHEHGLSTIASIGSGGLALGVLGGYLVGFLFAGGLVGWLAEMGWDRNVIGALGAMVIGEIVLYLIAIPWLAASLSVSPTRAIELGFVPFIIGDAIKLAIAGAIFPATWWLMGRRVGDR